MKTKCINEELLSAYYDKEITDINKVNQIEEHIQNCDNCKGFINSLNMLSSLVPKVDINTNTNTINNIVSFQSKTNENTVRKNKKRDWYYVALSAAAIILIIFTITFIFYDKKSASKKNQAVKIESTDLAFLSDMNNSGVLNVKKKLISVIEFVSCISDTNFKSKSDIFYKSFVAINPKKIAKLVNSVVKDPEDIKKIKTEISAINNTFKQNKSDDTKNIFLDEFSKNTIDFALIDKTIEAENKDFKEKLEKSYPHINNIVNNLTYQERDSIVQEIKSKSEEINSSNTVNKAKEEKIKEIAKPIKISEEQKKNIERILKQIDYKVVQVSTSYINPLESLEKEFIKGDINKNLILEKVDNDLHNLKVQLDEFKPYVSQLQNVFTPEQRKVLIEKVSFIEEDIEKNLKNKDSYLSEEDNSEDEELEEDSEDEEDEEEDEKDEELEEDSEDEEDEEEDDGDDDATEEDDENIDLNDFDEEFDNNNDNSPYNNNDDEEDNLTEEDYLESANDETDSGIEEPSEEETSEDATEEVESESEGT